MNGLLVFDTRYIVCHYNRAQSPNNTEFWCKRIMQSNSTCINTWGSFLIIFTCKGQICHSNRQFFSWLLVLMAFSCHAIIAWQLNAIRKIRAIIAHYGSVVLVSSLETKWWTCVLASSQNTAVYLSIFTSL